MCGFDFKHVFHLVIATLLLVAFCGMSVAQEQSEPSDKDENRGRTGAYTVTRNGVTGEAMKQVLTRLNALKFADKYAKSVNQDGTLFEKQGEESVWEIAVPDDYNKDLPYGVLVYISARDNPKIGRRYKTVLSEHRMIMIAAQNSGNDHGTTWRMSRAVDAVQIVSQLYEVDNDRIYVSGTSGGGRAASQVAVVFSDIFDGGFYFVGCNFYKNVSAGGGSFTPGFWDRPDRRLLNEAKKNGRYVLFTGSKDFNREDTMRVHKAYLKDGFSQSLYLEKPDHAHRDPPDDWFKKGMVFLDAPYSEQAAAEFEKAKTFQERDKLGAALTSFRIASARAAGQSFQEEANESFAELQAKYLEKIADVEAKIENADRKGANLSLSEFRKQWSPASNEIAKRLSTKVRKLPKN